MPLFQNTVITKYLKTQDKQELHQKWTAYQAHFLNPTIQENIRNSKEEQYQEGFLRDLFVNILGYTLNPDNNFNLTTELKNIKDSKKADGGILVNDKVYGVIELKGTNTTDLSKVEAQAFGYKNNQVGCRYVITSNFEKLRFYIDNAIEHIEFNLFQLSEEDFKLLYLCLGYDNLSNDIPKKVKDESISQEDVITKKLYKDYSLFKRELFHNLTQRNPEQDALVLFKKSQKLLDRFLFLFFAEDRHLLPPNSVRLILKQWKQLQELDAYTPLFDRFKKYFGYLNTGFKGKRYDVYPYNGGLFKPDAILDAVTIDDDLLYQHTHKLSEYDFASEVDVNILGHIFENSLNEIEEVQAQLEGQAVDKSKTKRKKDGVFYTPKYITKYIVENTVGKLCTEKKQALQLDEEAYTNDKRKQEKTKKILLQKLKDYREWLLQLTICDPACGSGAFLNEALNFLIAEHKLLDELETKLMGGGLVFPNIENSILEHNIYGVDINEESVEIAKLSLWLRTAKPNRKLNDLSNNIKCGNSLIDDPAIAGDKAFNWQQEFPQVFKEKDKKAFHITTALHDSRTSQRMIDYKVREKREGGTNPLPNVEKLTTAEEVIITKEIINIAKKDRLNIMAYNICGDHIHILLVCEEDERPKLMQKIKAQTARAVNIHRGVTITREHAPLPARTYNNNKGINPLVQKENEKSVSLWTQKYGCKEITTDEQLHNTINYIQTNREKHELPDNKELQSLFSENYGNNKGINPLASDYNHAFRTEYKGGFDVVIGNPPYVQLQKMKEESLKIKTLGYKTFESTGDLYCLFYEQGNNILRKKGVLGFITSNKWMRANYGKSLRKYFNEHTKPYLLIDLGSGIFASATVDSNLIFFEKENSVNNSFNAIDLSKETDFIDFSVYENQQVVVSYKNDDIWSIESPIEKNIKQKIEKVGIPLKDWGVKINRGLTTGFNEAFVINEDEKNTLFNEDEKSKELIFPLLKGREIFRYKLEFSNQYIINSHNGYDKTTAINISEYPAIKKHLDQFYPELEKRGDKGKTPYNLRNCAYVDDFFRRKIVFSKASKEQAFTIDENNLINLNTSYFLIGTNLELVLCVLNSMLAKYVFLKFYQSGGIQGEITIQAIHNIPIPQIPLSAQQPFITKADQMLSLNKDLQEVSAKFQRTLQRKFTEPLDTTREHAPLPKKLQNWYELSFQDFINKGLKPLAKKQDIKLSLAEEADWEDYFLAEQQKALALKNQIDSTDRDIDAMVYELYGLSEEEISIVENA